MQIKKRLWLAFGNTEAATGVLCILYKIYCDFFYMIRVQTYRKSFLYFSEEIKKTASTVSGIRRLIVQYKQNSIR